MEKNRSLTICLVALAILLRGALVLVLQSHRVPRSTYEHGEIAANLLAGRGFSIQFLGADSPTSQQAPVYPALVALAFAVGGVETPSALLLIELGQAVIGGMLVLGVSRLCDAITGGRAAPAAIAGFLTAVHPTLVYAATHVQVALLGATLLVWVQYWAFRAGRTASLRDALATGGLLAILTLTDPILALGGAGVVGAIFLGCASRPGGRAQAVRLSATCLLAAGLGVSPWIIRNALAHGEFVPVKSTFGYAFWQGNCALSEGTDKVVRASVERVLGRPEAKTSLAELNRTLWAARHEAGYIDDIALSPMERRRLGLVSEPERSRILFRRAIDELRRDPGRYLALCLRRLRFFWLFDETNPKTRVLAYRVGHLGLTILALAGLALAPGAVRARLAPTVLTVLLISMFHVLTITSVRFHVPIEPVMAVWAGAGLTRWRTGASPSTAPRNHVVGVRVIRGLASADRVV